MVSIRCTLGSRAGDFGVSGRLKMISELLSLSQVFLNVLIILSNCTELCPVFFFFLGGRTV